MKSLPYGILKKFCAVDDINKVFNLPFHFDNRSHATNRRLMVRCSGKHGKSLPLKDTKLKDIVERYFTIPDNLEFYPFKDLPSAGSMCIDKNGGVTCKALFYDEQARRCKRNHCKYALTRFQGVKLNSSYVALINTLPGDISAAVIDGFNNHPEIYFKFDGGDGILMPIREVKP